MASTKIHKADLPKIPNGFNVQSHLAEAEKNAEGLRFLCKVIGEGAEKVMCETDDGVYEFQKNDVLDFKSLNSKKDLLIIHYKSQFTFHSTLSRVNRVEAERLRLKEFNYAEQSNLDPPGIDFKEILDTVSFPGSHEWRGITD